MERRVLVAIFLSFLVLYSYQAFFVKPAPKPLPGAPGTASAPTEPSASVPAATPAPAVIVAATPAPGVTSLTGESSERDISVETPNVIATFTNRGGRLKSWRLKKYQNHSGQPLDLLAADEPARQALPFSLRVADAATTGSLNGAIYSASAPATDASGRTRLLFEYRDSAGVAASKEFVLDPSSYTIQFQTTVTANGQVLNPAVVWGPGLGDDDPQAGRYGIKPGGLYSVAGKVSRLTIADATKQPAYDQNFEYAGIEDHYFSSFAYKLGSTKVIFEPVTIPPPAGSKDPARELMGYSVERAKHDEPIVFYAGPKHFDTLAALDRNFTRVINFGIWAVIEVPLLRALNWIQGFTGNYGWSIVVLTILMNIVFFPLNHKSVVSMRKMQEIQPEMKAIQDRYAKLKVTDPAKQKMNQEIMALYRDRGVNPASGCVPLLLTFPVLIAFYTLLSTAIEFRGAPFIGWIHDLSQADAYYVLPILSGVTQLITQWMMPQTGGDPTQQKIMMFMPLVMTFVFLSAPAGTMLYWFVGGVWRIGQQAATNYLIGPPKVRPVRPAAERKVKRVGSSKTEDAAREN